MSSPSDIVKRGETAMQGVDLFITITDRSRAEQFAAWFRTHGISLVLTALGQGTATTEVLDFLGLEATEKAVLFCVSPRSPRLVRQAARDLWLDVPGQGVLMTVPVNSIGGSTAKEYLLHEQEGETAMEREIAHDLIVVIANQGSTDLVMDAAREAGATGGTVIHAKGTGTDLVRKFFGVSIASEQEMVFILARSEAKKPIMKAIMAKAGIQSAAQSLVFSLPVGDIAPEEYVREGVYHDPDRCAELTRELLQLPEPPTCILMPDDFSSIGGGNAIRRMGLRFPEDVSAAGYDGIQLASVTNPAMTTYRQDTAALGKTAAAKLIELIEKPRTALVDRILIPGKLVEGGSVRAI